MVTAVYVNSAPDSGQRQLIQRAVEGTKTISNAQLSIPHTLYVIGERKASVFGQATKSVSKSEFPFDWMHPMAKRLALMVSLAKDSDRILLLFNKNAKVPDLFVLMARAYNNTVRIYKGTTPYEPEDLSEAERQHKEIVVEPVRPLPQPTELFQTPNGATLRPYQQQMVDFAKDREGTGWFVDMGLGKTLSALALIDYWMKRGDLNPERPICIVAPIMVAIDTWSRECEKWGYDWDIKRNIRLTPKKRETLLSSLLLPQEKPTLFLTNPDQLNPVRNYFFSRNMPLPFESLIIDELSLFKSPTAKRNKEIAYYRRIAKKFLGLTGTPASNHLIDVWNQLKLISEEETKWAGRTIYDFQDKFFIPAAKSAQGFVIRWDPKSGAEDAIFRNAENLRFPCEQKALWNCQAYRILICLSPCRLMPERNMRNWKRKLPKKWVMVGLRPTRYRVVPMYCCQTVMFFPESYYRLPAGQCIQTRRHTRLKCFTMRN